MRNLSKAEALERLRELCSRSEKCLFDIRKKLNDWKCLAFFDDIAQTLTEENFVDEERYAKSFAHDKFQYNKWGKSKIKYHLKGRNIADTNITNALNEIDQSEYFNTIEKELMKKNKSVKEDHPYKRKQKLIAFGAQRGYETDIIFEILNSEGI